MSNNNVIPAEAAGQWRSWTMGELGGTAPAAPETPPPEVVDELPEEPPVEGASAILDDDDAPLTEEEMLPVATAFPTAAELEAIHQEAWQAGYDAGLAAGEAQGRAEGRAEGAERALVEAQAQFQQYWQPLSDLQQAFEGELAQLGQQLSGDVLSLAVGFAEKLVGQLVSHDAGILRGLLSEALDSLAESVQQVKIQVHPDELSTLQAFLGDQYPQWRMQWVANDSLQRGGCRIEAASSTLDLTLDSRMRLLRQGLGMVDEHAD